MAQKKRKNRDKNRDKNRSIPAPLKTDLDLPPPPHNTPSRSKIEEPISSQVEARSTWTRFFEPNLTLSALLTLRVGFFLLLAYDAWWIALSHAPRYGAGAFNVTHFELLDSIAPLPTPSSIGNLYLLVGVLSALCAFGVGGKRSMILTATLYNLSYFWSQADSYQHHYLLGLVLLLLPWITWRKDEKLGIGLPALYFQMAFIYFWTAVAKMEPVWLSGETLSMMVSHPDVRQNIVDFGSSLGWSESVTFSWAAWGVMCGELFATLAFLFKPLRTLGFLIIPWFHIMVEWIGFDIELFSYYMLLLNLCLLAPDSLWNPLEALHKKWTSAFLSSSRSNAESRAEETHGSSRRSKFINLIIVISLSLFIIMSVGTLSVKGAEFTPWWVAAALLICIDWRLILRRSSTALLPQSTLSFILSALCIMGGIWTMNHSSFTFNYYRMWGGDLNRRGALEDAYDIYQITNAHMPSGPARHEALAKVALKLNREEVALEALIEASRRWTLKLHEEGEAFRSRQINHLKEFERAVLKVTRIHRSLLKLLNQRREDAHAQEVKYLFDEERLFIQGVRASASTLDHQTH